MAKIILRVIFLQLFFTWVPKVSFARSDPLSKEISFADIFASDDSIGSQREPSIHLTLDYNLE